MLMNIRKSGKTTNLKYLGHVLEPVKIGTPSNTIPIIQPEISGTGLADLKIGTPVNIFQLRYLPKRYETCLEALNMGHMTTLSQLHKRFRTGVKALNMGFTMEP